MRSLVAPISMEHPVLRRLWLLHLPPYAQSILKVFMRWQNWNCRQIFTTGANICSSGTGFGPGWPHLPWHPSKPTCWYSSGDQKPKLRRGVSWMLQQAAQHDISINIHRQCGSVATCTTGQPRFNQERVHTTAITVLALQSAPVNNPASFSFVQSGG